VAVHLSLQVYHNILLPSAKLDTCICQIRNAWTVGF